MKEIEFIKDIYICLNKNRPMRKFKIIAIVIFICNIAIGQQDAMYTHYAFNTLGVNPAYAGSRDVITITGLHRSQWIGFDGAPITQTLTFHSPIFHESLGAGLSIINDKIGPVNMTSFYGDLSYRFKLTEKTKLAFGLKGGGNLMQGDLTSLQTTQQGDAAFANIGSRFLPNFGAGLYLFNESWYLGLSAPKFLENGFTTNTTGVLEGERRHYFFIAGAVFDISNDLKLKPTTFVKATGGAPIELDLTTMLIIRDKFEIGLMGRTGDAVGALIGYNVNNQMRIGYSFDWSFENTTGVYNAGSHEVMVRYDIINTKPGKIRSPRYF